MPKKILPDKNVQQWDDHVSKHVVIRMSLADPDTFVFVCLNCLQPQVHKPGINHFIDFETDHRECVKKKSHGKPTIVREPGLKIPDWGDFSRGSWEQVKNHLRITGDIRNEFSLHWIRLPKGDVDGTLYLLGEAMARSFGMGEKIPVPASVETDLEEIRSCIDCLMTSLEIRGEPPPDSDVIWLISKIDFET